MLTALKVYIFTLKRNMDLLLDASWKEELKEEFVKPYFTELSKKVQQEYEQHTCYPDKSLIFNAFNLCPFSKVKVVILGQDPYHEQGQAMGLSFSVPESISVPLSLRNIYKEVLSDVGSPIPLSGDLTRWAEQGVLLLNATLTVRAQKANSHKKIGWGMFTNEVIKILSQRKEHLVFMLWGRFACSKRAFIDTTKHCILDSSHPSPLSANRGGWFGKHHFSRCNLYLKSNGIEEIRW